MPSHSERPDERCSGAPVGRIGAAESQNLGDAIQSLALERLLAEPLAVVDRSSVDEDCARLGVSGLLIHGWLDLDIGRLAGVPSDVDLAFAGLRVADRGVPALATAPVRAVLERGAPVGCRDRATVAAVSAVGVEAWFSGCVTSTLPRRAQEPTDGAVYLVDAFGLPVPPALRRGARFGTHHLPCRLPEAVQFDLAERVLADYRDNARLVITSRLHCALPCAAMGIPVVCFAASGDTRFSALEAVGVPVHRLPGRFARALMLLPAIGRVTRWWLARGVDWNPAAPARTAAQDELATRVRQLVADLRHPLS